MGHPIQGYDATFSWTDADWTITRNHSSGSLSHYHYNGGSETDSSTSSGNFASGEGSYNHSISHTSHEIVTHAETSSSGTDTEAVTGGVATWSQSSSGSNSGYTETTDGSGFTMDMGVATKTGTTSRVDTMYSSNASTQYDRVDTTFEWANSAAQDGSAQESWSSGGTHAWNNTLDLAWSTAWTQTTTSGYSSGSGSGSGSSSGSGSGSGGIPGGLYGFFIGSPPKEMGLRTREMKYLANSRNHVCIYRI